MKSLIYFFLALTASTMTFSSPVEYEATYIFTKSGLNFAKSNHKMVYNSELDIWCISTKSKTIGIFSLKKDIREEKSCFKYTPPSQGENTEQEFDLMTVDYNYKRSKSNEVSIITSQRIKNILITYDDKKSINHAKEIKIDRLVAQLFGHSLKNVKVSDKGRERIYTFSIIGETKIDSVLGIIDTVIIRKEIEGSKRSTITWYARERNYLPVRIEQYRLNELRFKAEINEYRR